MLPCRIHKSMGSAMLEVEWGEGGALYDDGSGMGEVGSGKRRHVGSGVENRWCAVG